MRCVSPSIITNVFVAKYQKQPICQNVQHLKKKKFLVCPIGHLATFIFIIFENSYVINSRGSNP